MWEDGANHSLFIDKAKLTPEYLTIFENQHELFGDKINKHINVSTASLETIPVHLFTQGS